MAFAKKHDASSKAASVLDILVAAPWRKARPRFEPSPRARELGARQWATRTFWPGLTREEALAGARILTPCAKKWIGRSAPQIRDALEAGERVCARALCYVEATDAATLVAEHPTKFCDDLDFIAPVVAHAGPSALDFWFSYALSSTRRDRAFKLLPHLASPRMIPIVLDGYWRLDSLRQRARAWLRAFPEEALHALVPLALGASFEQLGLSTVVPPRCATPFAPAVHAVRWLASQSARERESVVTIGRALDFEAEIRAIIDVHPLQGASGPPRAREELPIVSIAGERLDATLQQRFLELLAVTAWDTPVPEVHAITDAIDSEDRLRFFTCVLDNLSARGRVHDLRCTYHMAADLPAIRRRLVTILRAELNVEEIKAAGTAAVVERGTPRGAAMLEVLGELALVGGTRAQEKLANEVLERVADALDVPRDTLDDRLVPRLGLSDEGTLPIGEWTARLDASLVPYLIATGGTVRLTELTPRAKKDVDVAAAWKNLRAGARKVATGLRRRAEQWMLTRQRWAQSDFRANVLGHPVLRELARGFVWGVCEETTGSLAKTFRVAEDTSFADVDDDDLTLPSDTSVRLLHPIELAPGQVDAWRKILAEYEVLPIFSQLDWPTFRLTDEERAATTLARLHGRTIEASRLPADLGWGGIHEGVWFNGPEAPNVVGGTNDARISYERKVANGRRVMVFFDPTGFRLSWKSRVIREVAVQKLTDLDWSVRRPWSEVDPVDASEMLREFEPWLTPLG